MNRNLLFIIRIDKVEELKIQTMICQIWLHYAEVVMQKNILTNWLKQRKRNSNVNGHIAIFNANGAEQQK